MIINKKFTLDTELKDIFINKTHSTERIYLTKTQYKIIKLLSEHKCYLSREKIEVFLYGEIRKSNTVVKHIENIRKKIGKNAEVHSLIENRSGFGYKLNFKTN